MSSTTINRRFNRKAGKQFRSFAAKSERPDPVSDPVLASAAASNALARQMLTNAAASFAAPCPDYDQPVPISQVKTEPVRWILPGWIPAGKISVLFGEPGVGKSQLSLDIAARLTSGREMRLCESIAATPTLPLTHSRRPRLIPDPCPLVPRNVLLFSAEDSVADTIKPRLEAAGADCDRVRVFPAGGHGVFADPIMLAVLIKTHAASLVIVDPLTAYAGPQDIYRDQHMRRMLAPLAIAAEKTGAAILLIHHTNKSARGSALMRSAGSIGITAAARSVMMVGKDTHNPSMRILAHVKGNLGAPPASIRFHFVQDEGCTHSRIQWDGDAEDVTADSLVQRRRNDSSPQPGASAHAFLRDKLASGPMPSKVLERLAAEQGFSKHTFERAKQAITTSRRVGGIGASGEWITELNIPVP